MPVTKISGKITNVLNCFFQNKFTNWHIMLNIYIRKTNFSSHKWYLFHLSLPRISKKTYTDQSILQTFLICLKRNVLQTYKSSSCYKVFSKCVHHWYNLLWWMFFIPCDNWKALFFTQIYRYPEAWYNRHIAAFCKINVLKEVCILYHYLHNNIATLLISKFQIKLLLPKCS